MSKPGVVYMESHEAGYDPSYTQHRCWDTDLFKAARQAEAKIKTNKEQKPTAVRFLSEAQYREKGGR